MQTDRPTPPLALWFLLWAGLVFLMLLGASGEAPDSLYHGQIEWARLKTQSPSWNRHATGDPNFLRFVRDNTNLNIDTNWHSADVEDLRQMTAYPFIFSEGVQRVTDDKGRNNLREYLQRDGFLFIDACINTDINPDPDAFLEMQIETLTSVLPQVRVERLPADHEIFRSCFLMKDGLPHTYMRNIPDPDWGKHGLYAVYSNKRFVSLISLSGLQCGWDGMNPNAAHITNCMKMMVNIYVYVISQ